MHVITTLKKSPKTIRKLNHHDNGRRTQHDEIEAAIVRQRPSQQIKNQGPNDGPFDCADSPNHNNEDDVCGPTGVESGFGRDAHDIQKIDGSSDAASTRRGNVHAELGGGYIDALAGRSEFAVADRSQREAVTGPEQ